MATLGIVGGIAPESTIEYYRSIIASYRRQKNDGSYPSILINSIDLTRMIGLIGAGEIRAVTEMLIEAVRQLARGGAEMALFASNTPHLVYEEVAAASPIPMISIVQEACRAANSLDMRRLGLFGTRFTMQAPFYPNLFRASGMTVIAPSAEEQAFIHEKYMGELVPGIFRDDTRARLIEIIGAMKERDGIDGVILGGTELPLTLKEPSYDGVTVLDTTKIHVESAVGWMVNLRQRASRPSP
ncbi:MAG TPA: amino acid racemase [Thermoanaerobaculia bacterium]|nr:amino acid racemase [Thermoanaerobaculia bacterium]